MGTFPVLMVVIIGVTPSIVLSSLSEFTVEIIIGVLELVP